MNDNLESVLKKGELIQETSIRKRDTLYAVYKVDAWHSLASRDLIGVCDMVIEVMALIIAKSEIEDEELTEDCFYLLLTKQQTQTYPGEGEFMYEEVQLNKLI